MKEQANEALAQIIERTAQGIDSTILFSQEHIPDIVQQLLIWNFMYSLFLFLLGIGFMVSVLFLWRMITMLQRRAVRDHKNGEEWTFHNPSTKIITSISYDFIVSATPRFFLALPTIIGFSMTFSNLTWLKILVAPKLYLLEYAASLVK